MKIFKCVLDKSIIGKTQIVKLPVHGTFLHAEVFNKQICIWLCITEGDRLSSAAFVVNFTGDELNIDSTYLATAIDHESGHVYHISAL